MKPVRLIGLAALAIALVGVAVWFGRDGVPQEQSPSQGLLWPELEGPAAQVDRLEFRSAGDELVEALERREGRWRVAGRDGWWADAGRVEVLLRDLKRARRLEAKTAMPERHGLLGVADIASAEATGTAVDITLGSTTRRLLVGHANPHSSGRFVRFADEPQAWLVDVALELPADPRQWLDRELLDIASRRVARLDIIPAQGPAVGLVRTPGEGSGHALTGAPAGRGIDDARVETAATLFEGLRLDDVKRDTGVDSGESTAPVRLQLQTGDGLSVDAESWREGPVRWMRLQVDFDEAVALGWVEAEIERDQVALEAAREPAVDGGAAAAAPLGPESVGIGPLDAAERLAALRADAQGLRARLEGWVFSLPPRKQAIIEDAHDEYLTPAD